MNQTENGQQDSGFDLDDGSAVAVIGGGAAGSLFSVFFLDIADRAGISVALDIYERKDFGRKGPAGCNMCGGIISESLVQMLATEGIDLPGDVVQRGIDAYVLHTDAGTIRIDTPVQEKRIAAVHRGAGPRDAPDRPWRSFDQYLLSLAIQRGASIIEDNVNDIELGPENAVVHCKSGHHKAYDLVVVATGVNTPSLKMFNNKSVAYKPPETTKTMIREYYLGAEGIAETLGDSMHLFLMNMRRLKFAAIIPKGDCASVCMMGKDVDKDLLNEFVGKPQVAACIRNGNEAPFEVCGCSPRMSVSGAVQPYADRLVFIGDSGVTRLYKDGIGAAYRTAKAAAVAAVFHGVSEASFARYFRPACRTLERDNQYGRVVFLVTELIQRLKFTQRGVLRMVEREQRSSNGRQHMSSVLWDTFTGSAPYRDIFMRTLNPAFLLGFAWNILASMFRRTPDGTARTGVAA